ncbi:MAG: 50S ribosomal protein L35 [Kiritimatiellae bacterium]|nr:50S ribosomal protein L35 [Kiritimatiellia bacterium]MBQ9345272.1 50S ribosomal protein L35 [Kiritimatiellia bacterium]
MATTVKKKTIKAVTKRFKKTATGKILHNRPGHRHLAASKTRKQKRHLRSLSQATGSIARALSLSMGK